MTVLSSIYRHAVWVAVPTFVVALLLLARSITGVVRVSRQARLFTASLAETQDVDFAGAGRVVLAVEGPLSSRRHAGLRYELVGPDGTQVSGHRLLFRAVTSGWTQSSIQLWAFEIERPGRHVLRIHGLGRPRADDAMHRVVFMRPHLASTVAYVIAMLLCAGLLVGSILLVAWRLLGVR